MRSKICKKVASRGKTQDILDRKIYAAVSCPIKTTVKIEIFELTHLIFEYDFIYDKTSHTIHSTTI